MKINIKDDIKINAALRAVNGRSASFCYTDAYQIRALAVRAEEVLSQRGVYKKNASGSALTARMAGPHANRYRYPANATAITLERTSGGWFLTSVWLEVVYPLEKEFFELTVLPNAGADIITSAMSGISVMEV
jgi:hypothetical protein